LSFAVEQDGRAEGGEADAAYCLEQIKRFDRDRFLTVLVAPRAYASDLAVLSAFNLELALIRDSVSETMLGLIRLQWWREAIAELFDGRPRRHAVVSALAEILRRRPLPRARFDRLIDARERDLDPEPPADLAALETYAAETSGNLIALMLGVAGLDSETDRLSELARRVGIATGLTGAVRSTLHLAGRRRSMLPASVLLETGVSIQQLYELKPQAALNRAAEILAKRAETHLDACRDSRPPRAAWPAVLAARLARLQLQRLKRGRYDLFDPRSIENAPSDIWRLAARRILG
jgi:phytoene/squalene synthetase